MPIVVLSVRTCQGLPSLRATNGGSPPCSRGFPASCTGMAFARDRRSPSAKDTANFMILIRIPDFSVKLQRVKTADGDKLKSQTPNSRAKQQQNHATP